MNSKLSIPLRNASFQKTFLFLYFFRFKTTFFFIRHDSSFIQIVPGRAGGGSFRGKKTINQRKNLPIECAQGDQPVRCPNRVFFVCTSLQPFRLVVAFWWRLVVFPWCVGGGDVMCGVWYMTSCGWLRGEMQ